MLRSAAIAALLMLAAGPATAQAPAPAPAPETAGIDWSRALAEDAQALHDLIRDNHPGPVDDLNPAFEGLLETGLAQALDRARTADSYEDWFFALEAYANAFDDGHLAVEMAPLGHLWSARWPGFMTGLRRTPEGEQHVVVLSRDDDAPPQGAVLTGCDGRDADDLARRIVGDRVGRWTLYAQRARFASRLFIDWGNAYAALPRTCDFSVGGEARRYDLNWRPLDDQTRTQGERAAASPRWRAPVASESWDGGVWIGLGDFDSDPSSETGQALTALVEEVEASADALRQAPNLVFDLRGNNGGSSLWIYQIARALWGQTRIEAVAPGVEGVDWRVSADNLALIEHYRDTVFAEQPEGRAWAAQIADGMRQALSEGRPLWRQGDRPEDRDIPTDAPLVRGRVVLVTDHGCASACLDAADLLLALGAVHVGQETSADTLYMDVRDQALPGGRATAYIPMKVFRGRPRGANTPLVPRFEWTGAIGDTAGLRDFILALEPVSPAPRER